MKHNRLIWILVLLFLVATLDGHGVRGQGNPTPQPQASHPDISKYGITDYNAELPLDLAERKKRNRSNQRYDNQGWVEKNPHPETGKIGRYTESEPPPTIPAQESDLIVTGRVVGAATHLSNDKSGVYSEYRVKVDQILKNSLPFDLSPGGFLKIDRAGGAVRYPHGQIVVYLDLVNDLPESGREYLLFLKSDRNSENYAVITLYELQDTKTIPLDRGRAADDIKRMGKSAFVKTVKDKLSKAATDDGQVENRKE